MTKVAAGFVLFRRFTGPIEYLLLQTSYGEHHWTPPKGHADPGESIIETAYRETVEESGISRFDFHVYENEKFTLHYNVKGKPKVVHYWLAELTEKNAAVKLSDEHIAFKWASLEEACVLSQFQDMIEVLQTCDKFIREKL